MCLLKQPSKEYRRLTARGRSMLNYVRSLSKTIAYDLWYFVYIQLVPCIFFINCQVSQKKVSKDICYLFQE